MDDERSARRILVNGIVQGVGFRPFVFQTAVSLGLTGEVANTSAGVAIHVEGPSERIDAFYRTLAASPPPLAHITEMASEPAPPSGRADFSIVKSRSGNARATLISPDVSICADCLDELFDPRDRRYRYPFINCTNCGPRYTIIDDIPYDRPKTSMRHFPMCPDCRTEYEDPTSRRFHAQPNACPVCGPRVSCHAGSDPQPVPGDPIAAAVQILKAGHILAVKGLGGFHLAVDAENQAAVQRLRQRKLREEKPFAVMSLDLAAVNTYAEPEDEEIGLLVSSRRPIVLLEKKRPFRLADAVAPNNRYVGVMLPYTPLHYVLMTDGGFTALVMTSGNRTDEPIAIANADALERLGDIADAFLLHDRDIVLRSDDSVVKRTAGSNRFLRRSRGFVPTPVFLKRPVPAVLACGAELKNTVCVTKGRHAFLSQHIGDLENLDTYDFFRITIDHLKRILDVAPEAIVCDQHPDYFSTRYAEAQTDLPVIRVQHHHAHIAACLAENQADGPVIGLSFDGTGYGSDGTIWGGEVLIADSAGFTRAGHIACVPMPGGAAAIREPWRMAVSHLHAAFGAGLWDRNLPFLTAVGEGNVRLMIEMMEKNVNAPMTSSLGRLFDAVAAMIGMRHRVSFEGQAAMELEMESALDVDDSYELPWTDGPVYRVQPDPLIRGVVRDVENRVAPAMIGGKFHRTLIHAFTGLCRTVGEAKGLSTVALSGGVFQNSLLLAGFIDSLREAGFTVLTHRVVPSNDGGISLGQAAVAAALLEKGK